MQKFTNFWCEFKITQNFVIFVAENFNDHQRCLIIFDFLQILFFSDEIEKYLKKLQN